MRNLIRNLIPTTVTDKNGHSKTVHKRPETSTNASAGSIPTPSVARPEPVLTEDQSRVKSALSQYMSEDNAEGFATYVGRRTERVTKMLADVLENHTTKDEFEVINCMLKDYGHNPQFMQLVMDDIPFVMALEEPLRSENMYNGEMKYGRALSAFEEAFTPAFRSRAKEAPVDFDYKKYGPMFRASVVTKMLRLNESTESTFDEYEQVQHVRDNMDRLIPHLRACKLSASVMASDGLFPTSDDMLDICDMLDEFPGHDGTVEKYITERKRMDMDELYNMVSSGSATLAEGAL